MAVFESKPVKPVPQGRMKVKEAPPTEHSELVEQLSKIDGLHKMIAASKQLNALEAQIVEVQANLALSDN